MIPRKLTHRSLFVFIYFHSGVSSVTSAMMIDPFLIHFVDVWTKLNFPDQVSISASFLKMLCKIYISHRRSPAAAAGRAALSGSRADRGSVSPSPHTSSSAPPPAVSPPPGSLAPAAADVARERVKQEVFTSFKSHHIVFSSETKAISKGGNNNTSISHPCLQGFVFFPQPGASNIQQSFHGN